MIREFSARKPLLRTFGMLSIAALSVCVMLSSALVRGSAISFWLEFGAFTLFAIALISCLSGALLMKEYAEVVRGEQRWWQHAGGWSWAEIKALTASCPASIKFAAWAVAGLGFLQCLHLAYAMHDHLLSGRHVLGVLAGASFFLGLSIPILLAAAFLKHGFAQEFGSGQCKTEQLEQPISHAQ